MADHYRTLGLQWGASLDEVKVAFRKLALLHHPDRHANASAEHQARSASRFKAITEAYEVLSDDRKRSQYAASGRPASGAGYSQAGGRADGYGRTYHHHNVNTDWARSRYSQQGYDYRGSQISWFQQLQRVVGRRRVEAGFALGALGLAVFGGSLVDMAWYARNKGKGFSDMQLARARHMGTEAGAAAADGSAGAGEEAAAHGHGGSGGGAPVGPPLGSHRPRPYAAVGCGPRQTSVLMHPGGASDAHLASMPLSQLIALEERALCPPHEQPHPAGQSPPPPPVTGEGEPRAPPLPPSGASPTAHAAGGGAAAAGGGGAPTPTPVLHGQGGWQGAATASEQQRSGGGNAQHGGAGRRDDDRVVIPQPSPPGFMRGHHT